ncbi:MAG TPA: hypothetical protein VFI39_03350 [Gemmatimonadales bacterium]|nr:hypothetical protein [Gemmatimonadales bacterium]
MSQPIPVITDALREHMRRAGIRLTKPKPWAPPKGLDRTSSPLADGQELDLDFEGLGGFTVVGETYAALGVIFYNADVIDTLLVSGWTAAYPPRSGSSVMIPDQDSYDPVVRVTTDVPVMSVGVYATSYFPVTLTCYDQSGVAIGADSMDFTDLSYSDYFRGLVSGIYANHHLQVAHAGIRSCGVGGNAKYYSLDDVEFNKATTPKLVVRCAPASVPRGGVVDCAVTANPAAPVTLTQVTATGNGRTVSYPGLPLHIVAGDTLHWRGSAVVSSTVSIQGRVGSDSGGPVTNDTSSFVVVRRIWGPLHYPQPLGPQYVLENRAWGFTELPRLGRGFLLSAFITDKIDFPSEPVDSVVQGPNAGWQYYLNPPFITTPVIALYQGLAPGDMGVWAQDQNGVDPYGTTGPLFGLRYCAQADLPALNAAAQRHEGVGMQHNSHYWQSDSALAASGLDTTLEALVWTGRRAGLDSMGGRLFAAFSVADSTIAARFDLTDYPNIFKSILGCEPDNDPYDSK